jgi:acetamidase/formamidase
LCIDILDLEHGSWGWSAILPGFGLLPEDFASGYVRTFDLQAKDAADFGSGIEVPLHPFMGTMAVNPGGDVRLTLREVSGDSMMQGPAPSLSTP